MIDDIRLDDTIEQGSHWGPTFQTSVVGFSSGLNERNEDWSQNKLSGDISYGIDGPELFYAVIEFFNARRGASRGFLFKDWSDFQAADVILGTGDGSNKTFLFYKSYEPAGATPYVRRITRPDSTTVVIKKDAVTTLDYTLGTGGWIEFGTAPANGVVVTASFDFFVPVRFVDDHLDVIMTWEQAGEIGAIKIEEIRDRESDLDTVCSITLGNFNIALHDDTDTTAHVRVADITVVDPFPTSETYLSGADSAYFEIDSGSLYLRAGTVLDSGTKATYAVTVNLRDPQIPVDPIDSDSTTITVDSDSEDAVSLSITVLIPNEPSGTSTASAIHVADLVVTGGHTGFNTFALSGANASDFQVVGTQLRLKAGTDGGTLTPPPSSYTVIVTVTDSVTMNNDAETYTLTVGTGVTPGVTNLTTSGPYVVPNYNFLQVEYWGAGAGGAGYNAVGDDGGFTGILSPYFVTAGGGVAAPLTVSPLGSGVSFNMLGGSGGTPAGGDVNTTGKQGANGSYMVYSSIATAFDAAAGAGAGGPDTAIGGAGATGTIPAYTTPSTDGTASGYPVYEDGTDGADVGEGGGGSLSGVVVLSGIGGGFQIAVFARPGAGGGAYVKKTYAAGALGSPAFGATLSTFVGVAGDEGFSFADGGTGFRGHARYTVT